MSGKEYREALSQHKQIKKAENIHLNRKNKHWREIQFIQMYQCSSNCFDRTSSTSTEQWPFTPALLWVVQHWHCSQLNSPPFGTSAWENTAPVCAQRHEAITSVCARHPGHVIPPSPVFLCCLTGSWGYFLPLLWGSPALKHATQFSSTASFFPRLGLSSKSELVSKCGFRKCFIRNAL